ncbi:MAG TPA: ATP synthase F0 subunit A, partial [Sulfitobacter sp.]|nr:ATP synthase F0 subunit A [Sulfitobacter sp.]
TPTAHFSVTVVLALAVFITVTVVGFVKNGAAFLSLFWVSSAPLALRPVLAIIELISYFVRPVSHSIRLAGNVMAGHAVIKVFAGFAAIAVISPVSVLAITAMYGLEVLVAFIQAYVFTILTCVYLKDALHPAH